jgi:hypothetical protein
MKSTIKQFEDRVLHLIGLANKTLATQQTSLKGSSSTVNAEAFFEFRTSSLSFILKLYGESHPYYEDFNQIVVSPDHYDTEQGRGILKSIKTEIENDWLVSLKGLISSEIFSDFLEMADYLLKENYKDPAAVMIGGVLEEHLRQLCIKHSITLDDHKSGRPKTASLLNSELSGAGVYNKLDQKNVTTWLDLRNKAAHGKYTEYNQNQVKFMMHSVTEFVTRNCL